MLLIPIFLCALASFATARNAKPRAAASVPNNPYRIRQARREDIVARRQNVRLRPRGSPGACSTGVRDKDGQCCPAGILIEYRDTADAACCDPSDAYNQAYDGKLRCCDTHQPFRREPTSAKNDDCCHGDLYKSSSTTQGCCTSLSYIFTIRDDIQGCCSRAGTALTGLGTEDSPKKCCYNVAYEDQQGNLQCCENDERYGTTTSLCCPRRLGKKLVNGVCISGPTCRIYDRNNNCCSESDVFTNPVSGNEECCLGTIGLKSNGDYFCCRSPNTLQPDGTCGTCVAKTKAGNCCPAAQLYTPPGSTTQACCESPSTLQDGKCVPPTPQPCSTDVRDINGQCCTTGLVEKYNKDACCAPGMDFVSAFDSTHQCCPGGTTYKRVATSAGNDDCCLGVLYTSGPTTQGCCDYSKYVYDISPGYQGCCSISATGYTGLGTLDSPRKCCYNEIYTDLQGVKQCCENDERYGVGVSLCCPKRLGKKLVNGECIDDPAICPSGVKDASGNCCATGLTQNFNSAKCCQADEVYQTPGASTKACCNIGKAHQLLASSPGPDSCCTGTLYSTGPTTKACCGAGSVVTGAGTSADPEQCCSASTYFFEGFRRCCKADERLKNGDCCPAALGKYIHSNGDCLNLL